MKKATYRLTEKDLLKRIYLLLKNKNKTYMNAEEASKYLGIEISYLYKLTHKSQITYYKTGKKNYFKKRDLDKYISRNKIPSIHEIKREVL
ncbi:MAG: helix-turn-helix domain-containing protein [bacterium]|nr:helix-turn-helix domain-containing protein [bacterium]